jgi:hypothetical protein
MMFSMNMQDQTKNPRGVAAKFRSWTDEELEILRKVYPQSCWTEVCTAIPNRTARSIYHKVHRLGIKKITKTFSPAGLKSQIQHGKKRGSPNLGKFKCPVTIESGVSGKICGTCKVWKPLSNFCSNPDCSGGKKNDCIKCEYHYRYCKFKDKEIERSRNYQRRNPEKVKLTKRISECKRHHKMMAGKGIKKSEWRALVTSHHEICAYCYRNPATTVDHVIPLSQNGLHEIGNVLPSCKTCNYGKIVGKHKKTLRQWFDHLCAING